MLYHHPDRRPLQDVITCIREHLTLERAGKRLAANAERHLKPLEEMHRLFRRHPEAVEETLAFIQSCRFSLDELKPSYPLETRQGFATPQDALIAFAEEGARKRYPDGIPLKIRKALDYELNLVAELNYAPYFLTVHDIVRFAKSEAILCQGRGSAANSALCFCLGVTEVDPMRSDLLFERFISAERGEPPDIDIDFEHERREEVLQYVYRKYGRERAGPDRHHDLLSRPQRHSRSRESLRAFARRHGFARRNPMGLVAFGRDGRGSERRGPRSGRGAADQGCWPWPAS